MIAINRTIVGKSAMYYGRHTQQRESLQQPGNDEYRNPTDESGSIADMRRCRGCGWGYCIRSNSLAASATTPELSFYGFDRQPPVQYVLAGAFLGVLTGAVCGALAGIRFVHGRRPRVLTVVTICVANTLALLVNN